MTKYYNSKDACITLGVCRKTLQNWAKLNKIKFIITEGNWRKYDVDEYLNRNNLNVKIKICYCRVSSYDQKEDLDRQILYLTEKYPEYEIIKDIGSGINFKRKGLLKIVNLAIEGIRRVGYNLYRRCLFRIGFDLLEHIFRTYSNTNIIIENNEFKLPEQEITEDLIEIITVYSSKLYGHRSYKRG